MVTIENLKDIVILSHLTDEMLKKFQSLIDVLRFEEDDIVFIEGDPAERFYFLKLGKVLLEKKISEKISFAIGAIKPGYSFGWSALLDEGSNYTTRTVCAEACQVYSIRSGKLKTLLSEEPQIGFLFTQRLLWVVKSRLDHRTSQFVTVLRNHPDIENLI
jgi:CRP/FNR family cyclic AMP-dependent transcriptional regulator